MEKYLWRMFSWNPYWDDAKTIGKMHSSEHSFVCALAALWSLLHIVAAKNSCIALFDAKIFEILRMEHWLIKS